jgi:hypothetical protein
MYNATRLDYTLGAEVDLPEAQADWVNRDCPGTLSLVEPELEVEPEAGQGDELSDTDASGSDTDGEAAKPARNRQHTPARTRK